MIRSEIVARSGYLRGQNRSISPNMLVSQRPEAVLLLKDGTLFRGRAIGHIGISTGEICFNTGMTGYQEIFTDPSYTGQIMAMASPHIGNYGVKNGEEESSKVSIAGLVVKKFSHVWSRPGGTSSLDDMLRMAGVVGISDVDTRRLVRHIRDHGAQNAIISSTEMDLEVLKARLAAVPSMEGLEISSTVSTKDAYEVGEKQAAFRVALLDFGVKRNIERCLVERDCHVRVFPMGSTVAEVLAWAPDGIMLSNGPGDPGAMPDSVEQVKALVASGLPVFGICLGHQLLAESMGMRTEKMHHGHRGINHPIKDLTTGHDEVTSQNHGFVVKRSDAEANTAVEITHVHLNDGSVAGIRLKGRPVFSVQYHPEAGPGPYDSRYLFDRFVTQMRTAAEERQKSTQNA
jgi:carbamoyl-phosphate synthase small subunit